MADEKQINSPSEIPEGAQYVLVMYGAEKSSVRHSRGVTLSIEASPQTDDLKILEFRTAVEQAKRLADKEGIPTVYVIDHVQRS